MPATVLGSKLSGVGVKSLSVPGGWQYMSTVVTDAPWRLVRRNVQPAPMRLPPKLSGTFSVDAAQPDANALDVHVVGNGGAVFELPRCAQTLLRFVDGELRDSAWEEMAAADAPRLAPPADTFADARHWAAWELKGFSV